MLAIDDDGIHVPEYDFHTAGLVLAAVRTVHVRDTNADALDDAGEAPESSLELAPDVAAERVIERDSARPDVRRRKSRLARATCPRLGR